MKKLVFTLSSVVMLSLVNKAQSIGITPINQQETKNETVNPDGTTGKPATADQQAVPKATPQAVSPASPESIKPNANNSLNDNGTNTPINEPASPKPTEKKKSKAKNPK